MTTYLKTADHTQEFGITRTFDILDRLRKCYPKEDILAGKVASKWIKYSTDDYVRESHYLACGFLQHGLQAGDKVITVTANRPEWNFIDMGLALAGMVHVPIYNTLSEDDYRFIIPHSDAKVVCIGSLPLYKRIAPIIKELPNPPQIIMLDYLEGEENLSRIREKGKTHADTWEPVIENNKKTIDPETCVTLIYTSGTTGTPKGVMLSHRSLVFNFLGHAVQQIKGPEHRMLSFLPLCHIYERTMNYEFQALGVSVYYAENLGTIARDLKDIHADGFCAVPRVLEMMYKKLEDVGKNLKGAKGIVYRWAFNFGCRFDYEHLNAWDRFRLKIADKLVYSKWRENLGGHEMLVVAGGSSCRAKLIRLFSAAKLYIYEGYGMTETSPVIAVNNPREQIRKIGTVGKVMDGVEMKFAEDGEILTRGPHLMLGYYKDPEATAAVIDSDGWLHTGDVGEMTPDGIFLRITDRKKEIFKLSNGKYVSPATIETKLNESKYIENSLVVGANEKVAAAIILPNQTALAAWAESRKMKMAYGMLLEQPEVQKLIHGEIKSINRSLAPHEQIKWFRLIADEWTVQNGLLSQTLKLKRHKLTEYYKDLIRSIYND